MLIDTLEEFDDLLKMVDQLRPMAPKLAIMFYTKIKNISNSIDPTESQNGLRSVLTKHFPKWEHADWDFDVEYNDTMEAQIKGLHINGTGVQAWLTMRHGDHTFEFEEAEDQIIKDIRENVNELLLALHGIDKLVRDET